ncbi:hypothetical protein KAI87_16370 [Myxococcota bacterium]|nr:hypothetical protein [Myxococcota bacterium]
MSKINKALTPLALLSYLFAGTLLVALAYVFYIVASGTPFSSMSLMVGLLAVLVSAVAGMFMSYKNILATTRVPKEQLVFASWVLLLLSFVPVGGPFFNLVGAVELLRGHIFSSVISRGEVEHRGSMGRATHYKAAKLGRSSLGGGLVFLFLAFGLQPAAFAAYQIRSGEWDVLDIEQRVNTWDGAGSFGCNSGQTFVANGKTISGEIRLRGRCILKLNNCTVSTSIINITGHAKLYVNGGKVSGPLMLNEGGSAYFHNVEWVSTKKLAYISGRARLEVTDSTMKSPGAKAMHAEKASKLSFKNTSIQSKTAFYIRDRVSVQMEGGSVRATSRAISIRGDATFTSSGTKIVGRIEKRGNAKVIRGPGLK